MKLKNNEFKQIKNNIIFGLVLCMLANGGTIYAASNNKQETNEKTNDSHQEETINRVISSKKIVDEKYYKPIVSISSDLTSSVEKLSFLTFDKDINYKEEEQLESDEEELETEEESENEEESEVREDLINDYKQEIALLKETRLLLTDINDKELDINKLKELKQAIRNKEITIDNINSFSMDEIIDFICKKYNLERYQFNTIASTVYHETWSNNYDDCYRVINTIYNRTKSKKWVNYISTLTGPDGKKLDGNSMYAQVIAKSQFNGCVDKTGSDFDELLSEVIYDGTKPFETTLAAIFNFLISEECVHSYLSFKGKDYPIDADKFTDYGNKYHELMQESDVLDPNYVIVVADKSLVLTRK